MFVVISFKELLPKIMAAAGFPSVFIFSLVLCYDIGKISENS